ncbi:MAG: hypothetical protein WC464_00225 [Bdellovibrionales bacterium]|jgi:hypothetical protein
MTKEDLITWIRKYDDHEDKITLLSKLDDFFLQNVVIPKGENRHPDADLFHIVIENPNLTLETDRWTVCWKEDECLFYKNGVINSKAIIRYRIKPSEPVYEWQWYKFVNGHIYLTHTWGIKQYFTEEEMRDSNYKKFEETKRERKND